MTPSVRVSLLILLKKKTHKHTHTIVIQALCLLQTRMKEDFYLIIARTLYTLASNNLRPSGPSNPTPTRKKRARCSCADLIIIINTNKDIHDSIVAVLASLPTHSSLMQLYPLPTDCWIAYY